MKVPNRTIKGTEYKYCGNHADPSKVSDHLRVKCMIGEPLHKAVENEKRWLFDAVLLLPVATETDSVAQLTKMDMVSVWKPQKDLP